MSENLTPGKYRVTRKPVWGYDAVDVDNLAVGDVVDVETGYVDDDGDVRADWAGRTGTRYVRASALTPVEQTFAVGDRVRVADHAGLSADGTGFVSPRAFGEVGTVRSRAGNGNYVVEGARFNQYIHPAFLTLVEDEPTPSREPLTFAEAYEKATAHRGAPSSAEDVAAAAKLA